MVNIEIKLITFFAEKGGEALHSQQKQDLELTVGQIMSSLLLVHMVGFSSCLLRDVHTVLHNGYISLHYHQACESVSFSPHPFHYL